MLLSCLFDIDLKTTYRQEGTHSVYDVTNEMAIHHQQHRK